MRIGDLRHRGSIETPTRVPSGDGFTETWTTLLPAWAAMEPAVAGKVERIFGAQLQAAVTVLVTIRWRVELTPVVLEGARWVFGGRIFHIRGWQHVDEGQRLLLLACEELPE